MRSRGAVFWYSLGLTLLLLLPMIGLTWFFVRQRQQQNERRRYDHEERLIEYDLAAV